MGSQNRRQLKNFEITPVVELQPSYMFDGVDQGPTTREEIQALFRSVVRPQKIASIDFLPGTDLLVPVCSLANHLEDLAEIFSYEVHAPSETEISGGFAFIENGLYVFGVEADSTFWDTKAWEQSIEPLMQNRHALIRHSWDHPFEAWLENDHVVFWDNRRDIQYTASFKAYRSEIKKAAEQLKEFALAFVPIYASKLNVPDPYEAALWNFRQHQEWFEEQSVLAA